MTFSMISDGVCTVKDLKFNANQELFGLKSASGVPHVLSTTGALHFAISNGLVGLSSTAKREKVPFAVYKQQSSGLCIRKVSSL